MSSASSPPAAVPSDAASTSVPMSGPLPFDPAVHPSWSEVLYADSGRTQFGCSHYPRGCKVRGPCCEEFFSCRLCHDEKSNHEINRKEINQMICSHCMSKGENYMIQPVAQNCSFCHSSLARYYCGVCKLFDDTPGREIYHCDGCGICRRGKQSEFRHCERCNACLAVGIFPTHRCIENVLSNCPICFEDLFSSRQALSFLECGHAIHQQCLTSYLSAGHITCPIDRKSIFRDRQRDRMIEAYLRVNRMPPEYRHWRATIQCNDCSKSCEQAWHFAFHRCEHCGSYNTDVSKKWEGERNQQSEQEQQQEQSESESEAAGGQGEAARQAARMAAELEMLLAAGIEPDGELFEDDQEEEDEEGDEEAESGEEDNASDVTEPQQQREEDS